MPKTDPSLGKIALHTVFLDLSQYKVFLSRLRFFSTSIVGNLRCSNLCPVNAKLLVLETEFLFRMNRGNGSGNPDAHDFRKFLSDHRSLSKRCLLRPRGLKLRWLLTDFDLSLKVAVYSRDSALLFSKKASITAPLTSLNKA